MISSFSAIISINYDYVKLTIVNAELCLHITASSLMSQEASVGLSDKFSTSQQFSLVIKGEFGTQSERAIDPAVCRKFVCEPSMVGQN